MPFVRCKFYSESGAPLGGGCRKKGVGCAFIHPGDPNWLSAPPPSFKARGKSGNLGGFKPWGERGNRSAAAPAWDTGGNTGDGWDIGGGWDTGGSTSTLTRVSETAQLRNASTTKSNDTFTHAATTGGNTRTSEDGWEGSADKAAGSTWSSNAGGAWGGSSWAENKDADKGTGPTWGSAQNDGWGTGWSNKADAGPTWGSAKTDGRGAGWGDNKEDAMPTWGSAQNGERSAGWGGNEDTAPTWGSTQDGERSASWGGNKEDIGPTQNDEQSAGWGDNKEGAGPTWGSTQNNERTAGYSDNRDATTSRGAPDPMIIDSQGDKRTEQNKGKGKAVPAPPRIRIPGNEDKRAKITGTNNEPLRTSKWGISRSSTLPTTSTPVTASTPVAVLTPTDPTRAKRKRDVAFGDKSDVFREYIKTWERGVRARFSLGEAEAKRDRWFRTQKSACFARIGEAGRKRLDGQRAECDKEVNSQKEKLSCAITSLVDFHDTFSSNLSLGQRYNVREEVENFIRESKTFVDEVRTTVEHFLRGRNDVQSGDIQKHTSAADATFTDSLRVQIRDLEERFDQAQTELTLRHQRDIRLEIEELLTAKIAGLRLARRREIDCAVSQRPEIVIPHSAIEKIEGVAQQVRELDAKVPHAVEDIRVLLLRVDATTKRVRELEEELSLNKETYGKMQEMAAERKEAERRADERLGKIRGQYEQLVASQPCGPVAQSGMSPTIYNSQDKLMESLRPAFEAAMDKFYEREVRPAISSLQQVVIEESDRHREEAIRVLWARMQPAMNMVAGVSRWLDSQELELTAPVEDGS